jgi:uncharacterized protein
MDALTPVAMTRQWLESVVIGLNLCPFARKPYLESRVRFVPVEASAPSGVLAALEGELAWLAEPDHAEVETSILIVTNTLQDFYTYNDFLVPVDKLIWRLGFEGVFQVASFHPDYQFADTSPEDPGNLTNRAPFPLLHILREASLSQVLEIYPDPDAIPERNIAQMQGLSLEQRRALFPYLTFAK